MIKKVNKKELSNIIGVSASNIHKLSEGKIKEKLANNCWELLVYKKEGRQIIYTLEYKEQTFNIKEYSKENFQVKNGEKFVNYSKVKITHIEQDKPATRKEVASYVGVSERTAYRYDKKLEEKGVISKGDKVKVFLKEQATEPINPLITPSMVTKLRGDWSNYIQPYHLEDECNICGSHDNLEVHHIIPFSKMLNDTIKELNMNEDNFNLELLRQTFIGKQHLRGKYVTLCKRCHLGDIHGYYYVRTYKVNKDNEFYKMIKECL